MSRARRKHRSSRSGSASARDAAASAECESLCIDALAAGGDGVGRLSDGCTVFVPFTAPGDRVRVRVVERRRRFARAVLEAVLEPAPSRVEPRCSVFGTCGGCSWQHVDYPAQLAAKQAIVADALRRIGGLAWDAPVSIRPSPAPYGYRARTRVRVAEGRVGYRRRASHAVCVPDRCPVLVPELERCLAELVAQPGEDGEWELVAAGGQTRATRLDTPGDEHSSVAVAGVRLRVSEGVFLQANALLHDALARRVLEHCGRGAAAIELYAGAGFFTLGLARRFERVVAVELAERAVADLRANLDAARISNVEVHKGDGAQAAFWPVDPRPAVALVDPPRTGLAPGVREALVASGAERLVYVSCDPATFARDAAALAAAGLALRYVEAFDLFPQTPHVEVLAVLERAGERAEAAGA